MSNLDKLIACVCKLEGSTDRGLFRFSALYRKGVLITEDAYEEWFYKVLRGLNALAPAIKALEHPRALAQMEEIQRILRGQLYPHEKGGGVKLYSLYGVMGINGLVSGLRMSLQDIQDGI